MDAECLRGRHVGVRRVELRDELADAGRLGGLVGADVVPERRVVADVLHGVRDIREVELAVLRMRRVARHEELLPHDESVLVAEVVEVVALDDAAAPEADEVYARLGEEAYLRLHASVVRLQHRLGYPVRAADEHLASVHVELAVALLAVGALPAVARDFAYAEAHLHLVVDLVLAPLLVAVGREHRGVQVLLALVARPPELRIVELDLERAHAVFAAVHADVGALLYARALDRELDELAHAPAARIVVDLDVGDNLNLLVGGIEELRADKRIGEARGAGREEPDRTPDAGVAVADSVREREVPADGHEHRHVLADLPVAAVAPLARRAPRLAVRLRMRIAGNVHRRHLYGEDVLLPRLDEVRNVEHLPPEHAGRLADGLSVDPYLAAVVDALWGEPHVLALVVRGHVERRAEPRGVVFRVHVVEVGNRLELAAVVDAIVRVGEESVADHVVQDGSRHLGREPLGVVEPRGRDGAP